MFKITDKIKILLPTGSVRFSGFCSRGLYVLNAKLAPAGLGQWLSQALPGASRSSGKSAGLPVRRRFLFLDCEDER